REQTLAVERLGDEAFNFILTLLHEGRLSAREKVNALRLLAALAGQFCAGRQPEGVDAAVRLARDGDWSVRSAGVHGAVWAFEILEKSRAKEAADKRREIVCGAISAALGEGVKVEYRRLAEEFFRSHGWELPSSKQS